MNWVRMPVSAQQPEPTDQQSATDGYLICLETGAKISNLRFKDRNFVLHEMPDSAQAQLLYEGGVEQAAVLLQTLHDALRASYITESGELQ